MTAAAARVRPSVSYDTDKPTSALFAAYSAMFEHFNARLFGGELPHVVLNFSRSVKALGFFAPERWSRDKDSKTVTHEISVNPAYLRLVDQRETAQTLVHEMVHLWQHVHGKPSRSGYHNQQWAAKMEQVGLMPSSTGKPGGARVGQRMSDYVIDGGPFDLAAHSMPRLPWLGAPEAKKGAKPKPPSKVTYECTSCDSKVWGKPGLSIVCGECDEPFSEDA